MAGNCLRHPGCHPRLLQGIVANFGAREHSCGVRVIICGQKLPGDDLLSCELKPRSRDFQQINGRLISTDGPGDGLPKASFLL